MSVSILPFFYWKRFKLGLLHSLCMSIYNNDCLERLIACWYLSLNLVIWWYSCWSWWNALSRGEIFCQRSYSSWFCVFGKCFFIDVGTFEVFIDKFFDDWVEVVSRDKIVCAKQGRSCFDVWYVKIGWWIFGLIRVLCVLRSK